MPDSKKGQANRDQQKKSLNDTKVQEIVKRLQSQWSQFTPDERIQEILHLWIGSSIPSTKKAAVEDPFLIISPPSLLFWDDGDGNAAAHFGNIGSLNKGLTPTHLRGSFLEAFLQLEFIIDHLLTLHFGGYCEGCDTKKILEITSRVEIAEKINLIKKYGLISRECKKRLNNLRDFRNLMAHHYPTSGISYGKIKVSMTDSQKEAWSNICDDTNFVLEELVAVYSEHQNPIIEWLLRRLTS